METLKKYKVIGPQPTVVRGTPYTTGQTAVMTDAEAAFPLSIGAIELAPDAEGAEPFHTMDLAPKDGE